MSGFKQVFLKDICHFEKGSTGLAKAIPGNYPLVATGADRRSCDTFQFDTKAVCIPLVSSTGHGHASINNIHYQEGKFALGSILVALTAINDNNLDIQFLHLYLSELKNIILVPLMSGAANVALSVTKIKNIKIPLPGLIRQQEIVAQFKSIEVEEKELINEIRYQQALLNKLRQSILQEAIEGKLTADWRKQNPKTEPASELLARIQEDKDQLIKDKVIKKQKPLPAITGGEIPFELPEGWLWCRIGNLATISSGKGFLKSEYSNSGVKLCQIANVSFGKTSWDKTVYVPESYLETYPELELHKGDLVMALNRPLLGRKLKVALLANKDIPAVLYQRVGRFDFIDEEVSAWLFLYLRTSEFSNWLYDQIKGVNIPFVNQTKIYTHTFPIPPILEQKAIVTKVEKLLTLCDQLEQQINTSAVHTEQLMQAVLKEAFQQSSKEPESKETTVHA